MQGGNKFFCYLVKLFFFAQSPLTRQHFFWPDIGTSTTSLGKQLSFREQTVLIEMFLCVYVLKVLEGGRAERADGLFVTFRVTLSWAG